MNRAEGTPAGGAMSANARLLRALALVLATAAVYLPSLRGELVYDDLYLVAQNPQIRDFGNLPEIFRSSYWDFLDAESASHVGYYRPLATVAMMAAYAVGGGATWAFHALSILVHLAAAFAAWLFAARLLRDERAGFWAGLLFALHPLHVESVAWISAVNVPLFGLFSLLALASWVGWRQRGSRGVPVAAGLALLAGLLSKEAAAAVIPMVLVIELARRLPSREERAPARGEPVVRAWLPLAAAVLLYYGARVVTFGDWRAGFDRTTTDFGVGAGRLALLRVELLGDGLRLLTLPLELDLFRPFRPGLDPASAAFLVPLAWTLALVGLVAWFALRGRRRWLALAALIPAGIAPVLITVRSLGTFPVSDRFYYLPAAAFAALLAGLLLSRLPRAVGAGALALVAGAYGWRSLERVADWRDETAVFTKATAQHPDSASAWWGLGRVQLLEYRASGDPDALAAARASYERAMDLLVQAQTDDSLFVTSDDHRQANLGLAWTLLLDAETDPFHDYATARTVFERVTDRYPDYYMGWIGLGVALVKEGRLDAAGAALRKGLDLNPRAVEGLSNMARLLMVLRDYEGAERHYRRALELRPDSVDDRVGLARALELQGELGEALHVALEAREAAPRAADPRVELGLLSIQAGNLQEALRWFDEAVGLEPNHGPAWYQRGTVLALLGEPAAAAASLERAVELMPNDFDALYNLAALMLESNEPRRAIPVLARAYAVDGSGELGAALRQNLIDIEIESPDLLWQLAAVDLDRNQDERAKDWARRALARDPEHGPSHMVLGLVLAQEEELDEAWTHMEAAARALPDNFQVLYETGALLARMGRNGEALGYLQRALAALDEETSLLPGQKEGWRRGLLELMTQVQAAGDGPADEGG